MKKINSIEHLTGCIDMVIANFEANNWKFADETGLGFNIDKLYEADVPFTEVDLRGYKITFCYVVGTKELDNDTTPSIITQDSFKILLNDSLIKLQGYVEGCLERAVEAEKAMV